MSNIRHVIPRKDLIEHLTDKDGACVCGPPLEAVIRDDGSYGWLYVHHSLDGREKSEPSSRDR